MTDLTRPRLEGTVVVDDRGRRIGFSEFGTPRGRPVIWMHGTPGGRRQVPEAARVAAYERNVRIVGIDRPGVGLSTPHRYGCIRDFAADLDPVLAALGIEQFAMIGLSGGAPYVLGCAHAMADRMVVGALMGGVAPTCGADAAEGGVVALTRTLHPALARLRLPLSLALSSLVRLTRPFADPGLEIYARISPEGDRRLLLRPDFGAMFLDDLLNGSRPGLRAPVDDIILFGMHWGFELSDIKIPVRAWHGDRDHIVPFAHGEHVVSRLRDAELHVIPGQSHLGGLDLAEDILDTIIETWKARVRKPRLGLAPV